MDPKYYKKRKTIDIIIESLFASIILTFSFYFFASMLSNIYINLLYTTLVFFCFFIIAIYYKHGEVLLTEEGIKREKEQQIQRDIQNEKNKISQLYNMRVGTTYYWTDFNVTRVPGGWIFERAETNKGKAIFIPENKTVDELLSQVKQL